eukprot:12945979-Ditylum_brightwellii.AAC.1
MMMEVHGCMYILQTIQQLRKFQRFSHQKFTDQYEVYHDNSGYIDIDKCHTGDVGRRDIRMHLDTLVKLGYMNKDVASSMKKSADSIGTDDDGDEYLLTAQAQLDGKRPIYFPIALT